MPMKAKKAARQYFQSEGNLAFADESLASDQRFKPKHLARVMGGSQALPEEQLTVSDVLPVRSIMALVCLSLMLWCLIVLTLYWIHFRF